jgi:hypothetical protein
MAVVAVAVLDGNRGGLPCKLKLQEVESVTDDEHYILLANLVFIVTVLVSTPRIRAEPTKFRTLYETLNQGSFSRAYFLL